MNYTDNVSPAPLLGWWAPRLAPVPSPAHTPVRRAPAAPPWAPGWIKKLLWIMSAKISTCSCSFLLGRRSCSSSLVGFVLLCMGSCKNNNIDGLRALFSSFRIRKSCCQRDNGDYSPAAAPATTSSLAAIAHLDLHAVSTKSGSIKLLASVGGITSVLKSEFVNSGKQILPSFCSPPSR